jgi:hypothetical protein
MATWTDPPAWGTEVPTAASMNSRTRDLLLWLKDLLTEAGDTDSANSQIRLRRALATDDVLEVLIGAEAHPRYRITGERIWFGNGVGAPDIALERSIDGSLAVTDGLGSPRLLQSEVVHGAAEQSGTLSIASATWTAVPLATVDQELGSSGWWNSGQPTRLTVPYTGVYNVVAAASFALSGAGTQRVLGIGIDGSSPAQKNRAMFPFSASSSTEMNVAVQMVLQDSTYLSLYVRHDTGGALVLDNARLSATLLGIA